MVISEPIVYPLFYLRSTREMFAEVECHTYF